MRFRLMTCMPACRTHRDRRETSCGMWRCCTQPMMPDSVPMAGMPAPGCRSSGMPCHSPLTCVARMCILTVFPTLIRRRRASYSRLCSRPTASPSLSWERSFPRRFFKTLSASGSVLPTWRSRRAIAAPWSSCSPRQIRLLPIWRNTFSVPPPLPVAEERSRCGCMRRPLPTRRWSM